MQSEMSGYSYHNDETLFHVLKECKTLPVFFDAIFGFLKRRTDFFEVSDDADSAVGLPRNLADNIVKQSFSKWKTDSIKSEVCDTTMPAEPPKIQNSNEDAASTPRRQFKSAECYNGAVTDNYMWSQSINDLDVTLKVPEHVSTKQLDVKIDAQHLIVRMKDTEAVIFDGALPHKVKHTDALWSLDQQHQRLEIHMDKVQEMWWNRLIDGEEPIDIATLDCSRPFDELSDEAQAKIEELQWNQDRKRLGLPTTQQMQMQETLKKAWAADGSPFNGPYDPKAVIMEQK